MNMYSYLIISILQNRKNLEEKWIKNSVNVIINLLMTQLIKSVIIFIVWYISGLLVLKKNVKVNYTRKINHFTLLIIPYLMGIVLKRTVDQDVSSNPEVDIIVSTIGLLLGLSYFLLFLKPIRE